MVRKTQEDFRWTGVVGYVLLVNALSWQTAVLMTLLGDWGGVTSAFPTRILAACFLYFLVTGWQPLLAASLARRWLESPGSLDEGWRPSPARFLSLAWFGALVLMAVAALTAWAGSHLDGLEAPLDLRSASGAEAWTAGRPSLLMAGVLVVAYVLMLSGVWLQCFAEEVGWRGYLLTRLVARLGGRRGLLVHGLAWGLWYAPLVMVLAQGSPRQAAHLGHGFIMTCVLLGCLLGWLRLASRSLLPAVLANVCLTLGAGLPLLLLGEDVGLRGAVYEPPGWIPLGVLAVLVLACGRAWKGMPAVQGQHRT
jgi:membrane protease YdiL (CAAX protease family)